MVGRCGTGAVVEVGEVAFAVSATWLGETFGGGAPLTIWSSLLPDMLGSLEVVELDRAGIAIVTCFGALLAYSCCLMDVAIEWLAALGPGGPHVLWEGLSSSSLHLSPSVNNTTNLSY